MGALLTATTSTPLGLDQTTLTIAGAVATVGLIGIIIGVFWVRRRVRGVVEGRAAARDDLEMLLESDPAGLRGWRRNFARSSWLQELLTARSRVRFNKWSFLTCRFVAVAGALVLPALASQSLGGTPAGAVSLATFSVSVAVAVSAGALQVFKFGNEWGIDEEYANALEAEGWAYFQKAGHYRDFEYPDPAFQVFFKRIEDLRRLRGDRRVADIRDMALEASKEPGAAGTSQAASEPAKEGLPSAAQPVVPALPDFKKR